MSYAALGRIVNDADISQFIYNYYIRNFPSQWSMEGAHAHEAIEIICCQEGTLHIRMENGDVVSIKKSDCMLLKQEAPHFIYTGECANNRCVCIQLSKKSMKQNALKQAIGDMRYILFDDAIFNDKGFIKVLDNASVTKCVVRIIHELNSKHEAYDSVIKAEILGLIMRLSRNLSWQKKGVAEDDHINQYLERSIEFMKQEMTNPIGPREIAKEVNISVTYLMHLFKKNLSKTIMQVLTEFRVERAKDLLLETTYNVTEVSLQCGYNNLQHFSMQFKKSVGVSPLAYRRNNNEIVFSQN